MLPPEPDALRARLMVRLAAGLSLQPGAEQRRRDARRRGHRDGAPARRSGDAGLRPGAAADRAARSGHVGGAPRDDRGDPRHQDEQPSGGARRPRLPRRRPRPARRPRRPRRRAGGVRAEGAAPRGSRSSCGWPPASATTMALLEGRFAEAETLANEALRAGPASADAHGDPVLLRRSSSCCAAGRLASPRSSRSSR